MDLPEEKLRELEKGREALLPQARKQSMERLAHAASDWNMAGESSLHRNSPEATSRKVSNTLTIDELRRGMLTERGPPDR